MKSLLKGKAGIGFVFGAAIAAGISARARAEDARVLPQGRSRFSMIYGQTSQISQQYDNNGTATSLTAQYNFEVNAALISSANLNNAGDMVKSLKTLVDSLNATGKHYNIDDRSSAYHGITTDAKYPLLGDALSLGFLNTAADVHQEQYNFTYFYGLTDKLTIGISMPYIKRQIIPIHSMTGVNTANDIYYGVAGNPQLAKLANGLNQVKAINDETFQSLLQSQGYDRVDDYQGNGIGDVVMGARYNYLNKHTRAGDIVSSFQAGVTVPSGRLKDPANVLEQDFGSGAWQLGAGQIFNYTPISLITLSNGWHYTYKFANSRVMRIRADAGDMIPDLSDQMTVQEWQGDEISTSLGAKINLSKAINIDNAMSWWYKRPDRFNGPDPNRDYSYETDGTEEYLETFSATLNISMIPAFMKYDFPVPIEASVSVAFPITGKNAVIAPYGAAELAVYF